MFSLNYFQSSLVFHIFQIVLVAFHTAMARVQRIFQEEVTLILKKHTVLGVKCHKLCKKTNTVTYIYFNLCTVIHCELMNMMKNISIKVNSGKKIEPLIVQMLTRNVLLGIYWEINALLMLYTIFISHFSIYILVSF